MTGVFDLTDMHNVRKDRQFHILELKSCKLLFYIFNKITKIANFVKQSADSTKLIIQSQWSMTVLNAMTDLLISTLSLED